MAIFYYLILVLHVAACVFLIAVVLLQQGKGQDLASAFGGGGSQAAFGPRGSANLLTRATTILAAAFMVTSLALSIVKPRSSSILDRIESPSTATSPVPSGAPAKPAASAAPAAPAPAATTQPQ